MSAKPAMNLSEVAATLGPARTRELIALGVIRRRSSVNGRKPLGLWFDRAQVLEIAGRPHKRNCEESSKGEHALHLYAEAGEWHVWLNTGVADFDGLCLGVGGDRQAAVTEAVKALEWALEILQGPPPAMTY